MAASTIVNGLDKVIREELSFVERRTEPEVDGIFSRFYTTSEGVTREGIGRDFQVIHTFSTGLSGAFKNISAEGDNLIDADDTGQAQMMSPSATFPTVSQSSLPGFVQKKIKLVQGAGVFALPIHVMQADALDASTAKVVALTIQGTAKKVAQSDAISFYSVNSGGEADTTRGSQAIMTLGDVSAMVTSTALADGPTANSSVTIDVSDSEVSGSRIADFMPGMLLDHFTSAGVQKNASGEDPGATQLIVGNVDYTNNKVDIHAVAGIGYEHDSTADFEDDDYLTLAGSGGASGEGHGPAGPNYWLKNTGTIYGSLNLATHSQFKSVVTAVNGVLDEATLNANWGKFYDAYGSMNMIDSIVTTAGVINQYIENIDGLFRYERSEGGALKLKEGWTEFDYTYQGMTYDLLISRYQRAGRLWGLKLRNQNLKRYVPPSIPGAGTRKEFANEIQWYGPLVGLNNIFLPVSVSDAVAMYIQAPFFCFREICPEQIPGILLTGLDELTT